MILLSQKSKGKKKQEQETGRGILKCVLDYVICIYILIMLVIFPFYYQKGYSHIGTDKSVFFRTVGWNTGKLMAVLLLLYLISLIIKAGRQIKEKKIKAGTVVITGLQKLWKRMTWTDLFAGIYGLSLVLSYFFSDYKENALLGAPRWYMGLVPQLILLAVYFWISWFWKPRKWMFQVVFPASFLVFALGILNRFSIYPIQMESANSQFISTIGNINWYCGYSVSVVFAGIVLYWLYPKEQNWEKNCLMLYSGLGFASLVVQGSDSGILTLVVIMIVLFCFSAKDRDRMEMFWKEMILLWGGCTVMAGIRLLFPYRMNYPGTTVDLFTLSPIPLVMLFVSVLFLILIEQDAKKRKYREGLFKLLARIVMSGGFTALGIYVVLLVANRISPGSIGRLSQLPLFIWNESWGSLRGATWSAGVKCFLDQNLLHKLVGIGPDCMAEFLYSGADQALMDAVWDSFLNIRLTNAHNEWITILVNMGILGLIGFVGMIVGSIVLFIRKRDKSPIICACGFCLLAYTINNMFSFQQSMNVGTMFVLFGMGMAFFREEKG